MKNLILSVLFLIAFTSNNFAQEIKFGKVSKEAILQKEHQKDSTATAAYLYNKRRTAYLYDQNNGFMMTTDIHKRIKVYSKDALKKGTFLITLYNNGSTREKIIKIKGYAFNDENGKIVKTKLKSSHQFKEKINDNFTSVKVVFPDVKEGTVIDLMYTVTSPFITSIDPVNFQYDIPVDLLDVSIETPEYFNFRKASKGYYAVPVQSSRKRGKINITSKSRSEGFVTRTSFSNSSIDYTKNVDHYNAKDIPALKDSEPFVSNINNYRGGIKYELSFVRMPESSPKYYATTWEDVSKKIYSYRSFGNELNKSSYYKDELAATLSTAKSEYEKLGAIFQLVKSKVKWNGNYGKYTELGVKKAFKDGVGNAADINLMLTSMLRSAGLNANPVLVSSRSNGVPIFPTLDGFNYVISMVEFANGKYALLDATEPYSLPNSLPVRALNWNGRKVLQNGASSWVKLSSSSHSTEENKVKLTIEDDGTSTGFVIQSKTKLTAMQSRKRFNHLKEDELISKFEESYNIEIDDFKSRNEKNIGKPLSRMFKFSSEDLVEEINGKLYINPLLFLTMEQNPFKSDERKFPIDFATPWSDSNKISIKIPEGYKVEFIPEQLAIGIPDNLGFFKFVVTENGNTIQVNSKLQFNSAIISPTYYPTVKDFFKQLVAKQNEKIIISKQ
ncbi:transglutaminase domain-containing protein [uncultured Tenacibaculum sp.]|uniref:transglutaminase domain-containing protein n=1 Tax=uncultured Tenacibaculum sp. TaxID=174713 RepID=UPI0026307CEC|nr:transglutaminase domain-containing protein [uncultured Tenacibaculum sp.]